MSGDLEPYRNARDLERSPEPAGEDGGGTDPEDPIFVIQEHEASTHHWDFRLEVDGVLRSWAVPKGPSTDPSEKRLAVPTEDHPLGYADFEGVIPEDEYGAGAVIIWDRGTYENLKRDDEDEPVPMAEQLEGGHAVFALDGEKLRGGYALQRFDADEDEERWLLVKMDDEEADARRRPTSTQRESVASGRTIEEVAESEADPGEGSEDEQ